MIWMTDDTNSRSIRRGLFLNLVVIATIRYYDASIDLDELLDSIFISGINKEIYISGKVIVTIICTIQLYLIIRLLLNKPIDEAQIRRSYELQFQGDPSELRQELKTVPEKLKYLQRIDQNSPSIEQSSEKILAALKDIQLLLHQNFHEFQEFNNDQLTIEERLEEVRSRVIGHHSNSSSSSVAMEPLLTTLRDIEILGKDLNTQFKAMTEHQDSILHSGFRLQVPKLAAFLRNVELDIANAANRRLFVYWFFELAMPVLIGAGSIIFSVCYLIAG